ncbi:HigA family addiction module antitoxin [Psychroserpens damuponensis]|uniref:HigA family addiction module antitoxin n=1 Tax=Psychroserpens damuponensis TaxID=943936 RepID=UPI00058FE28F|nr:HigA family addiction module antitoxin [Psychroserpens damuponensis]
MSKLVDERELLSKPGDTILETIEHIGMSQVELAERMGKTPSKINDIISSKEPITLTTALQLEKVLGIDAQFWLNREMLYREKLLRIDQEETLEKYIDWLKIQPIKELKEYGYLKTKKVSSAMAEECLKFYGVASPVQWESLYVNQYAASSFRKSDAHKITLGGLAAFLRMGEVEMRKLKLGSYSKDTFKEALKEIRTMVRIHPEDFALRLQQYCSNAGVAVIFTANIPKAPISGVARWVGGIPLIQLTDRYKSNDHFWFSFFHEAGHILLHGKKDVFIEDLKEYELDTKKEIEADNFASKWLLPENITAELSENITEKDIRQLARKYNTHAAVVLARLQYLEILPYSFGNKLKLKVVLDKYINRN